LADKGNTKKRKNNRWEGKIKENNEKGRTGKQRKAKESKRKDRKGRKGKGREHYLAVICLLKKL